MNRRLITLWRIIKTGMRNFVRNATLAIAAMAVMVITLTIVLFSVVANATFSNTINQITDKISISIYLKDSVTPEQRGNLEAELKKIPNIKSTEYVSKDEALRRFKDQNVEQNQEETLVAVAEYGDNPLPASIEIKTFDTNKIEEIKNFIDRPDVKALQSAQTSYSGDRKEAIDNISQGAKFLRNAGLIGVAIFLVVSMLIIFNTIQMAIFNRRDELTIERLLGASNWFIRGPFVVETILYGIMSALVSVLVLHALFKVSSAAFKASSMGLLDIDFANNYFVQHFWLILTSQIAIGILIGAVSSIVATRRYLKFKSTK